jgi:hypothetical protein
MVVTYTASGDSFHAVKPQLWSPGQFTELGLFTYNFDLHPDGKRIAVLKAPGAGQTAAATKELHLQFLRRASAPRALRKVTSTMVGPSRTIASSRSSVAAAWVWCKKAEDFKLHRHVALES